MNPQRKRLVRWTVLGLVAILIAAVLVLGIRNPGNIAQTAPNSLDIRLRPRRYSVPLAEARRVVLQTIPQLRTYGRYWKISHLTGGEGLVPLDTSIVRAEVPVLVFTDDLVVTIHARKGGVVVDVHSQSRVGKGDFGENRRHIIQLLSALDRQLKAV